MQFLGISRPNLQLNLLRNLKANEQKKTAPGSYEGVIRSLIPCLHAQYYWALNPWVMVQISAS